MARHGIMSWRGRSGTRFAATRLAGALLPLLVIAPGAATAQDDAGRVTVHDRLPQVGPATFECQAGHQVQRHLITLENEVVRYTLRYSGCLDESHGDLRPSAEGNFGMPDPTTANWYWGGFFGVLVNGTDAVKHRLKDMRGVESGARGGMQALWAHPDADVSLRLLLLPGANHILARLVWAPREDAALNDVALHLRCYPSFFTAARNRKGERHCRTPRIDLQEPETLTLEPAEDTYLLYYDAVFDTERGEGDGPCAVLLAPEAIQSGRVSIGDYAVSTVINLDPAAGEMRFALYDFTGKTNAEAQAYMEANADRDLARLIATDFRPAGLWDFDMARLRAEALQLLSDAAADGAQFRQQVDELLTRSAELEGLAQEGDLAAEAELAGLLEDSADLFWKLRAFALLNRE